MLNLSPLSQTDGVPLAVVDALNSLLESELQSLFPQLQQLGSHLDRAHADLRRPLADMAAASVRHAAELASLIESLGGTPLAAVSHAGDQYLNYLSVKFFLPKLIEACRLTIERYSNALAALTEAPESVTSLLRSHLADYQSQLALLEQAAAPH
jgi:hypothetical protein